MRYRLPEDVFDGGEYEGSLTTFAGEPWVRFDVDGVRFYVGLDALTEVKPPLPEEPPDLTVLRAGTAVYQRDDGGGPMHRWWMAGRAQSTDWPSIADLAFTRLVPEPFAEPVELPWQATGGADGDRPWSVGVETSTGATPMVLVNAAVCGRGAGVYLFAAGARRMARALWAAADAAEKGQS